MKQEFFESISVDGELGPIQVKSGKKLELEIAPLTIFIGPQGSGKSLISQLLYFFRDAKYLLSQYSGESTGEYAVRGVVEGLRTGKLTGRKLATFLTTSNVHVAYRHSNENIVRELSFYHDNYRILPIKNFSKEVSSWSQAWYKDISTRKTPARVLYIPAERTFYSRFFNSSPATLGNPALPITMQEFSRVLTNANDVFEEWQKDPASMPPEAATIAGLVLKELRGRLQIAKAGPYARKLQWVPVRVAKGSDPIPQQAIEIEMASSGQMEAVPLVLAAQALFDQRSGSRPTYLHIEEPEAHLHPAAQVALVNLLAYLVNQRFRIVITTHSLTILYAINNLMAAAQKLGQETPPGFPSPQLRLNSDQVGAYLFTGETIEPILLTTPEGVQIDEGRLGEVLGSLQTEYNQILGYGFKWE
jgi:hypothetical protein